jgi:hypothetical protein
MEDPSASPLAIPSTNTSFNFDAATHQANFNTYNILIYFMECNEDNICSYMKENPIDSILNKNTFNHYLLIHALEK